MLAQSNSVGNRRRAVPRNLSHAPLITDTSSPLRIMELCEQNVIDPASAWVREKRRPSAQPFTREGCEGGMPSRRQRPIHRLRSDETKVWEGGRPCSRRNPWSSTLHKRTCC
jgi:hypothetical protein